MIYNTRITKLTKRVERTNPKDGKLLVEQDEKFAFEPDVQKYIDLGYKEVEIIVENKDFTPREKAWLIDRDETCKRDKSKKSQEQKSQREFESSIMNMTSDELQETVDRYDIPVALGTFETIAKKKKAVLDALLKMEEEFKAKQAKAKAEKAVEVPEEVEEPIEEHEAVEESGDLKAELSDMTVKQLEAFVEERELDITLSNYSKKAEKINAIIDVIENKG